MLIASNLRLFNSCHLHLIIAPIRIALISTNQIKEYCDTLKINDQASKQDVKDSFLRLSKIYHPDNNVTGSHTKFVQLKEAYDALKGGIPKANDASQRSYPHRSPYEAYAGQHSRYDEEYYRMYYRGGYPGGPFANSQDPWADMKKAREYRRSQQPFGSSSRFKPMDHGNPLVHVTLFFAAFAWITIFSGALLAWEYNDEQKKSTSGRYEQNYKEYLALQEELKRHRAMRLESRKNRLNAAKENDSDEEKE